MQNLQRIVYTRNLRYYKAGTLKYEGRHQKYSFLAVILPFVITAVALIMGCLWRKKQMIFFVRYVAMCTVLEILFWVYPNANHSRVLSPALSDA